MGQTSTSGRHPRPGSTPDIPPPKSGTDLLGKTMLGQYQLLRYLGAGSNADVYLAQVGGQPGKQVVVKRIKPHVLQGARFRQFFDAEVSSMTRFKHPYAVRLFDASLDDPLGPCLVLEYINGVTLESVLDTFKRLPVEHAVRLLCQLCHALLAAHKAGIMHRDLKPANLMVQNFGTKDETLKVMDFGFAGFTAKPFIQLASLTGQGEMFACGTPAYVSPEMIRGDSVDSRADLYSVGVIFFEMLTGRLPFDFPDLQELLDAHASAPAPKFAKIGIT
ncbi:MAG: serine/threonine-protein kinase, partial [Fimbriiglobus sp.]